MLSIILMELFIKLLKKYLWFLFISGKVIPTRNFCFCCFSQFLTDFKNNLYAICVRNRHSSNFPRIETSSNQLQCFNYIFEKRGFVALLSKAQFSKSEFEEGNLFRKNTGSISYKDICGNGGFSILIGGKASVSSPITKCRSFYFQLNNPLSPTHSIFWTIFDWSRIFVPRYFRPWISSQCTSKCSIVANNQRSTVQGRGKLRTKLWFRTNPRS